MQIIIVRNRLLFKGKAKDLLSYLAGIKNQKISLQEFLRQHLQ